MKRHTVSALLLTALALALPQAAPCAERLVFEKPLVSSENPGFATDVSDTLDRAASAINRLYGGSIEVAQAGAGYAADYTLSTIASQNKDSFAMVVSLTRRADGTKTPTLAWVAPVSADLPLWLARAVFLLWSSFHGYLADQAVEKPVFVDELPGSVLHPAMPPMGITVTPTGTLVVPLVMTCVELNHAYKRISEPGKTLADKGVMAYAGGASATPGGSIILKPSMGRDLYRVQPGAAEPQRIPTGVELSTIYYWAALADGSALLVDAANRKAYRSAFGKKRQELPLFPNPSSWPTAYAAGPDGSIWEFDPALRGVRIFTSEGNPVDILLPLVDPSLPLAATAMAVGPDGSFVMLSNQVLYKFSRDGRLAWALDALSGSDLSSLPTAGAIGVDWSRGLVYLSDTVGKRIVKLIDRAYCREKGISNDLEEQVIALRGKRATDESGAYADAARLYEAAGSALMAKAYWQKVEDVDPGNPDAEARLLAIEVEELKAAARDLDARARSTLAAIGIETARPLSLQAIQTYELILSKSPGDEQSRKAMADLKDLFSRGGEQEKKEPLTITELRIANLFPALMQWYASHPPGSVTVKNTLAEPVEKVRASFLIPRFMDLPVETKTIAKLAPGESVTFDLAPVFNQTILELQEDMAVQVQVVVTWAAGGGEQTMSRAGSATIYRNSALTWDDTRKISSFITPNEQTVASFAARTVAAAESRKPARLSRTLFQAMRICDALGAYGIAYVPDPDSPFSRALGKAEIVDTVRFPRTTLHNRTGDCDDTTALLCSLLESAGIPTAILTTPGHIFLAFDSGEPTENAPYLTAAAFAVIARGGSVWVPVETTILSQGFMAAWASASDLVKKCSGTGSFEFIPVAEMRDTFPALPLPADSLPVAEPAQASVDRASAATLATFTATLYTARLKEMDASLSGLSGRQAVRVRVQEGILHALFGTLQDAEAAFRKAITDDPGMISPYVNLANVRLLANDGEEALQTVKQALARNADSALLNLLAARIYAGRGDAASTAVYYARVKKESRELAARFADLIATGNTRLASSPAAADSQRAAQAGETPVVVWSADQ